VSGREVIRILGGLILLAAFGFLLISLLTLDPGDPPDAGYPPNETVQNAGGVVGAYAARGLSVALGLASYVLVLAVLGFGVALLVGRGLADWPFKLVGLALLLGSVAALMRAIGMEFASPLADRGGMVGVIVGDALRGQLGAGAYILLGALLFAGLFLTAERLPLVVCRRLAAAAVRYSRRLWEAPSAPRVPREPRPATRREPKVTPAPAAAPATEPVAPPPAADEVSAEGEAAATRARLAERAEPPPRAKTPVRERARPTRAGGRRGPTLEPVPSVVPTEYRLPPVDLLDEVHPSEYYESEETIRERAAILERTLDEFGIEAQVVEIDRGPVITVYELEVAAGIKITRVAGLSDDIARALKSQKVRIVAPIPGKSTIGVEVPNQHREIVRLRELIESGVLDRKKMTIPLLLGKDTSGTPLVADLAQMPHLLIAGATGSGKSVCINALLLSMLMTQPPDHLKLILVDPKMVELATYEDLPHLLCPVLTDMKRTASVLEWATVQMDARYEWFSQVGVRNLAAYNKLGERGIRERLHAEEDATLDDIPTHLPIIVIIIDELADLMMTCGKEAEYAITRLAQKSRAIGIHIIMATQRPSVNVITGLIKANMPSRIAFQTTSMIDSRTILDKNGAEMLLGRGDMLFLPPGTSDLVRGQGAFASEREIRNVADFWRDQGRPEFHTDLAVKKRASEVPPEQRDDLYRDAVRIVLATERGSVSLLQRKLQIGYSRAARLIDMMAEEGIVGDYKGSQAREVLLTLDEWERINAEDLGLAPEDEPDEAPGA